MLGRSNPARIWLLALALALAACGGSSSPQPLEDRSAECPDEEAKDTVFAAMRSLYLWNDESALQRRYDTTDLAAFSDERDLLDSLRWRPQTHDRGFTYVTSPAAEDRQNAGRALSWGFLLAWTGASELRVQEAIEGGPVAAAGVRRGFSLLAIDGRSVEEIGDAEGIGAALGYPRLDPGTTRTMRFRDLAGREIERTIAVAEFDVDPVPIVRVFENGGTRVGYVLLRSFVPPAVAAFEAAIERFRDEGVRRVIVDLRYNGGGSLPVAEAIAGMLAAPELTGERFYELRFNREQASNDQTGLFAARYGGRSLAAGEFEEVHFVGTQRSASASELLINGFRPWRARIGTGLVGSPTFGKPVGQAAADYCNDYRRLRIVTFRAENADGFGEFFDGLSPDCPASDDLDSALGETREGLLAAALQLVQEGTCAAPAARAASARREAPRGIDALPLAGRYDGIL